MRGDLDSIALKALEKDRSRRYGSPSDFAADIGRYLKNEAVLAVPPSVAYRARKFARRYRAALATACAFALVLIAAAVISIRQSIRANREAAVAQAVNDFLQNDLLAQASAATQSGPSSKPDPRPEGAHRFRPCGGQDRRKVRQATGGGGLHSRHHREDLYRVWAFTRRQGANWSARWSCAARRWVRKIRRPSKPQQALEIFSRSRASRLRPRRWIARL